MRPYNLKMLLAISFLEVKFKRIIEYTKYFNRPLCACACYFLTLSELFTYYDSTQFTGPQYYWEEDTSC